MTRAEVLEMVRRVLRTEFELEDDELSEDARLGDDLELDSVDAVALAVRLEEETGIALEEEALKAMRTVRDVVGVVSERLGR
ncbi:MAG TPA: acyl carrier protein [Myxococcota bacterium]|nr:acyl carrier protein [Myxococcota bacterium]